MDDSLKIRREEAARILRLKGIRPITHRVAVYEYLCSNPVHPSAETIFLNLSGTLPSLSRTTVFNVLKLLCENGIVRRITVENDRSLYDANTSDHVHFKCIICGSVHDIFPPKFPEVELPRGYVASETQMNVWGYCSECSRTLAAGK